MGAHDEMWFVARDLAFGANAYPDVDPPANIARPEAGQRWMPEVAPEVEGLLSKPAASADGYGELGRSLAHISAEVGVLEERWLVLHSELDVLQTGG